MKGRNRPVLQPDAKRAEYWSLAMTELPSVSGSAEEAAFPDKLVGLLRQSPAFRDRPDMVWTIPVPGGRFPRACVAALARGRGRRTVILTGHFDTVPIEDYGDLKPNAGKSALLKAGLLEKLRENAVTAAEKRALADFATDDYLPGRGLLDMKAGLAAGLAVIEAFLAETDGEGNILFLGVPDEEVNSAGARAAAPRLTETAALHGLDIVAAINLDAIADDGDGSSGRAVALGTIGKLLPTAMVVGQPTHAGYSFAGLSACTIAGALATEIEWAPGLTERHEDQTGAVQIGAGPTLLGMKDSKTAYDVTTPDKVWMYWNVMLYQRSPGEVIATLEALARQAADTLLARLVARRPAELGVAMPAIRVTTFQALCAELEAQVPGSMTRLRQYALEVAGQNADLPEQCRLVTEFAWKLSGRGDPTIILGFGSTPYLPTLLGKDEGAVRLRRAVEDAAAIIAQRHQTTIALPAYFLGISDMSFLGQANEHSVPAIAANTPAWGAGLHWPAGEAFAGIPIVNAGPWGRDYHTVLERLHTPYAFHVLPELIAEIVLGVVAENGG